MMRTLKVPRGILPVAVITMVGLAVLNAGCGGHGGVARWIRAAFIYVGPISDLGWSYAHDQGRQELEQELGTRIPYREQVSAEEAEAVLRAYVRQGRNLIFATSFDFGDAVLKVARDHPDVIFEHVGGDQTAPNVGIYEGRTYQGWYLAGLVAGRMTQRRLLGYIAPHPIPEVIRDLNAFTLGARSVNPNVQVHPVWIFTWVDPAKEREAAQQLIDLGADVIARRSDSVEADQLAEQKGVYAIGNDAISTDVAPNAMLTAPICHWGVFYRQVVQDIRNGTWTNTPVWWGLKEGLVDLAPLGRSVPEEVRTQVEQEKQRIIQGEFDVFVGPIRDNTGQLRVPEGETLTDEEKQSLDWLVEGIVGPLPASP